jgi:poly-beta-1,6-N-acetyl-D-glucosamine synthase
VISNPKRIGKKQSITAAMALVKYELVILRDADTYTVSNKWLSSITSFHKDTNCDLLIAPVKLSDPKNFIQALQSVENNVLALLTGGSAFYGKPFLCNGANLAFTKGIFDQTNGFSSHLHVESGDDVLFLEDVKKVPGATIRYLKSRDAIVETYPERKFRNVVNQRVRWASKFKYNRNKLNLSLAVITFLVNALWLACVAAILIFPGYFMLFLLFIFFKVLIDLLLLFLASRFMKQKGLSRFLLPVAVAYPFYAVIIALRSLFAKPNWKSPRAV